MTLPPDELPQRRIPQQEMIEVAERRPRAKPPEEHANAYDNQSDSQNNGEGENARDGQSRQ